MGRGLELARRPPSGISPVAGASDLLTRRFYYYCYTMYKATTNTNTTSTQIGIHTWVETLSGRGAPPPVLSPSRVRAIRGASGWERARPQTEKNASSLRPSTVLFSSSSAYRPLQPEKRKRRIGIKTNTTTTSSTTSSSSSSSSSSSTTTAAITTTSTTSTTSTTTTTTTTTTT